MKDWEKYGTINRSTIYKKYNTSFVNSYAEMNVSKDFAETFTHFIFLKKIATTAFQNEKIRYFYKNKDMVI